MSGRTGNQFIVHRPGARHFYDPVVRRLIQRVSAWVILKHRVPQLWPTDEQTWL